MYELTVYRTISMIPITEDGTACYGTIWYRFGRCVYGRLREKKTFMINVPCIHRYYFAGTKLLGQYW